MPAALMDFIMRFAPLLPLVHTAAVRRATLISRMFHMRNLTVRMDLQVEIQISS
jgi:hypothetical protein